LLHSMKKRGSAFSQDPSDLDHRSVTKRTASDQGDLLINPS
jgi:hypothetical protein